MNPLRFSEILADIPDEFIVSAAEPQKKTVHWSTISAVAACIVLLISAAVYPRLRVKTPEMIAPSATTTETVGTTTTEQTHSSETQTTAATVLTKVTTIVSGSTTAPTTATETEVPIQTEISTVTQLPHTTQTTSHLPLLTTVSGSTTEIQTTITYETTAAPIPEPVPLWKGDVLIASGEWFELPKLACMFRYFPAEQYELLREEFGIPQEVDLSQCLLMTVQTGYADTAIVGCKYAQNGLILQIAYLETGAHAEQTMRFAIPIPEYLLIAPDNCTAEFIPMTDGTAYQALLTDSLYIENIE